MKSKLITILVCACISAAVFFAAGCNDKTAELEKQIADLTAQNEQLEEENAELSAENEQFEAAEEELNFNIADWQKQIEDLQNSIPRNEEQIAEAQRKYEILTSINWDQYGFGEIAIIHIIIRPEYVDKEYTVEDFVSAKVERVERDGEQYVLYLSDTDPRVVIRSIISIAELEFIDSVQLEVVPETM